MYYINVFILLMLLFLNACSQNHQKNGLSVKKLEKLEIEIGKTSKDSLNKKYGPPIFESAFNDNIIYYVSHNTSYKIFEKRKTDKLLVYEIILDDRNIVQKYKQYTEKDSYNLDITKKEDDSKIDFTMFWKDIINAMRKQNLEN